MLRRDSQCCGDEWGDGRQRANEAYNKERMQSMRAKRQPKFKRALDEKEKGMSSREFGSRSGLWMESSGSTKDGERSAPQARGSGESEYWAR